MKIKISANLFSKLKQNIKNQFDAKQSNLGNDQIIELTPKIESEFLHSRVMIEFITLKDQGNYITFDMK